jgi:hypothetical protein
MKSTGSASLMNADPSFPKHFWWLLAVYCAASLVHFAHNAEYIAFYPNMPPWLTRENVYLAWLAVAGVGLLAIAFAATGWRAAAAVSFVVYGALGLDGLGHYWLALCSQHTFTMNLTIWAEALAGSALAACAGGTLALQFRRRRRGDRV